MAKTKRKGAAPAAGKDAEGPFALWGQGDLKSARSTARQLLAGELPPGEREKLERLLADTAPDPRALHIAFFCLAVVAMVVLLTKLFG